MLQEKQSSAQYTVTDLWGYVTPNINKYVKLQRVDSVLKWGVDPPIGICPYWLYLSVSDSFFRKKDARKSVHGTHQFVTPHAFDLVQLLSRHPGF